MKKPDVSHRIEQLAEPYEDLADKPSKEKMGQQGRERIPEKELIGTIGRLIDMEDEEIHSLGRPFLRELILFMKSHQRFGTKRQFAELGERLDKKHEAAFRQANDELEDLQLNEKELEKARKENWIAAVRECYQEQIQRLKQLLDEMVDKPPLPHNRGMKALEKTQKKQKERERKHQWRFSSDDDLFA